MKYSYFLPITVQAMTQGQGSMHPPIADIYTYNVSIYYSAACTFKGNISTDSKF